MKFRLNAVKRERSEMMVPVCVFLYIWRLKSRQMQKIIQLLKNFNRKRLTHMLFNRFLTGLKPGGIAIDCGANVGDIATKLAKTGIRVYAFEPNPYAFQKLQSRVALKEKRITNIRLSWL
jgi:hypothetical protein